jgi:hypothetical protein
LAGIDDKDQSSVRLRVVVTAISLVLAALLLVALRPYLEGRTEDAGPVVNPVAATTPSETAPVPPPPPEPAVEPFVEPAVTAAPRVVTIGIRGTFVPPEPARVVLLPARAESRDPAAQRIVEGVRQAMLRSLRGAAGVVIVEISAAELAAVLPANAGTLRDDNRVRLAIMDRYAGRLVAEVSEQSPPDSPLWGISLHDARRPNGMSATSGTIARNGDLSIGTDVASLGERFARSILQHAGQLAPSTPATARARAVLLDPTRAEEARLGLLSELLRDGMFLYPEEIAAAVDLATRSASPSTRASVWRQLGGGAYDLALAQPLGSALLTDPDPMVRREAALALATYREDVATRATLEHALRNDSVFEVRLAAQMSAMDLDEQRAFMRRQLLDKSLPPLERLAPTTMIGMERMPLLNRAYGSAEAEEALAIAEIVTASDDPVLKLMALGALQTTVIGSGMPGRNQGVDSQVARALIDAAQFQDRRVRRQALNILVQQRTDNPEVRALLESVLENEPALAADLRIEQALAPPVLRGMR